MAIPKSRLVLGASACFALYLSGHAAVDITGSTTSPFKLTVTNNTAAPINLSGVRFYSPTGKTFANMSDPMSGGVTTQNWGGKSWIVQNAKTSNGGSQYGAGQSKTAQHWSGNFTAKDMAAAHPLIKIGQCNQPSAACDPPALSLDELKALMATPGYYDASYRTLDTLGIKGGLHGGGLFDSFCGETQLQVAIPSKSMTAFVNGQAAYFDTTNTGKGPFLWMGLSANQEFFQLDYQWFIGKGRKETQMLVNMPYLGVNDGTGFTPFELEPPSFVDRMVAFKQFFPHQSCVQTQAYGDALAGACGMSQTALAALYMGPAGGPSHTDKPWIFNEVFMSGIYMFSVYDMLAASTDLGFRQFIENSFQGGDPKAPMCLMAAIYNRGPGRQDIIDQIKPVANGGKLETLMDDPAACDKMEGGFGNYTRQISDGIDMMANASRKAMTDASWPILERWITLDDLKAFYFGEGGDLTTPELSQNGGVLMHFKLDTEEKRKMWQEVQAAFELQAAKWPLVNGKKVISLRYDWLSNLRISKKYFNRNRESMGNEWLLGIIKNNSKSGVTIDGSRVDANFPFANYTGQNLDNGGFRVIVETDESQQYDRGVNRVEWTLDNQWRGFTNKGVSEDPASTALQKRFFIDLDAATVQRVQAEGGGNLWIRVVDACGNAIVQSTELNGPRQPKITAAAIWDRNGDGKGDEIQIQGLEYQGEKAPDFLFADFDSVQYQWPDANARKTRGKSEVVVDPASVLIQDQTIGGIPDEKAIQGEVRLRYRSGELKGSLKDSIGPVLVSAGMREKQKATDPDSVILVFNRDFAIGDSSFTAYFKRVRENLDLVGGIERLGPRQALVIYPAGTILPTSDSIWINPLAGIVAQANARRANDNNQKVLVQLWRGPLVAANEGNLYLDQNGNGQMDMIQLKFQQEADEARLSQLEMEFTWKVPLAKPRLGEGTIKTLKFSGSACQAQSGGFVLCPTPEAMAEGLTWFDNKTWGQLKISQPEDLGSTNTNVQIVPMGDGMGPVILTAEYKRTAQTNSRPDYVDLTLSEPIDTKAVTADQLLRLKRDDVERPVPQHATDFKWSVENRRLRLSYPPELKERPRIGDSVRIEFESGFSGLLVDPSNNKAHTQNPFRLLDGKLGMQLFVSGLGLEQTSEDKDFLAWKVLGEFQDVDSTFKTEKISGFALRFPFGDSSQSIEERQALRVNYEIRIFDQGGGFVTSKEGSLTCKDIEALGTGELSQACNPAVWSRSRDITVLLPWNHRSKEGRLVGAGAYLVQAEAWSQDGKGKAILKKQELSGKIGVARSPIHKKQP
jgi:hypothetical protein